MEVPSSVLQRAVRYAGALMIAFSAVWIVYVDEGVIEPGEAMLLAYFGAFALWALTYRHGITLDAAAREVRTWWGFVVPLSTRVIPLAEFECVTVGFGRTGKRHARRWMNLRAEVVLSGPDRRLVLRRYVRVAAARGFGEQVAEHLSLELVDLLR